MTMLLWFTLTWTGRLRRSWLMFSRWRCSDRLWRTMSWLGATVL